VLVDGTNYSACWAKPLPSISFSMHCSTKVTTPLISFTLHTSHFIRLLLHTNTFYFLPSPSILTTQASFRSALLLSLALPFCLRHLRDNRARKPIRIPSQDAVLQEKMNGALSLWSHHLWWRMNKDCRLWSRLPRLIWHIHDILTSNPSLLHALK
jgi:hypothetical protein